jgi:hypothetical protein
MAQIFTATADTRLRAALLLIGLALVGRRRRELELPDRPLADRARIEAEAAARLSGYGWADRETGRARIPIERAMTLLAEHGWPDPDAGGAGRPARAPARSTAAPDPEARR